MTWTERQPVEKESLEPWLVLPLKEFEYTNSHKELKPDMAMNARYPEVEV